MEKNPEFLTAGDGKKRPIGRVPNFTCFLLGLSWAVVRVILTQTCVVACTYMTYTTNWRKKFLMYLSEHLLEFFDTSFWITVGYLLLCVKSMQICRGHWMFWFLRWMDTFGTEDHRELEISIATIFNSKMSCWLLVHVFFCK